MKYRELLELYDKKKLPEELQKKVEQDIERQEAISEYLFEKDDLQRIINKLWLTNCTIGNIITRNINRKDEWDGRKSVYIWT